MPEDARTQTTGTPGQDDGDAADRTQTTGTPDAEGRDAGEGGAEPDYKDLYLKNKVDAERLNRAEARLREIEASDGDGSQPATDAPDDAAGASTLTEDELEIYELRRAADAGNILAKRELKRIAADAQQRRGILDGFTWTNTKDEELRDRATAIYQDPRNKGKFNSFAEVVDRLEKKKLGDEKKRLEKELADLRAEQNGGGEGRKDVVRTVGSADVNNKTFKATTVPKSEFDETKRRLYAEGRDDEARQMQRDLIAGKIVFRK